MIRAAVIALAFLPAAALAAPPATLSPADEAAAFRAADFARVGVPGTVYLIASAARSLPK